MKPGLRSALALLLFALVGCTALAPKPDPLSAAEHQNRAEMFIATKQYQEAVDELSVALKIQPKNAALYLRTGELLEALKDPKGARACYEKGLRKTPTDDPGRVSLTYHLGLLYATKLESNEKARTLLKELPQDSLFHQDLEAAIALQEGEGRRSISLLNEMLQTSLPRDMAARVMYQAALAYHLLGDTKNSTGSLLKAVSFAENLALIKDIEAFWNRLNSEANPSR